MGISVTDSKQAPSEYVVMGGTFDPVHNGHIRSAEQLVTTMGYNCVYLMPCGDAYHKQDVSHAKHRVAMLELAAKQTAQLQLDLRETKRGGATYTVDTLTQLRKELGDSAHICWVLGTDAAQGLVKWHHWQAVFKLANVIVIHRAGLPLKEDVTDAWPAQCYQDVNEFKRVPQGAFIQRALEPFDVSSTEIRQAINQQQSVDSHVPQAVLNYIEQHGLYRGNH